MIHWHEVQTEIPNLEALLAQHREQGGFIIQYDRIVSALVYTRRTAVYEWVPTRGARYAVGLRHAGWCALLGWWSWTGLIVTGMLIFNNVLGGLDFTRVLTTPPPVPGSADADVALKDLEAVENWRRYLLLAFLLVVLAMVFLVLPRLW